MPRGTAKVGPRGSSLSQRFEEARQKGKGIEPGAKAAEFDKPKPAPSPKRALSVIIGPKEGAFKPSPEVAGAIQAKKEINRMKQMQRGAPEPVKYLDVGEAPSRPRRSHVANRGSLLGQQQRGKR